VDLPTLAAHPERIVTTERYRRIAQLDAYYRGTQYDHLPDWYTGENRDGEAVPLRERRPCIVSKLPSAAVRQAVRFTLGEGRFPQIKVGEIEAAQAVAGVTLAEDEAAELTAYIAAVVADARLKSVAMQVMRTALACRTGVGVASLRRGHFCWDLPHPSACLPVFFEGDVAGDVDALLWCYPFGKTIEEGDRFVERMHFFRRDFGPEETIAYLDAPAPTVDQSIDWQRDEDRTKPNEFGFVPAVWVRNMPDPHCHDSDGLSLYDGHLSEIDAHSFALSQQHRTINYHGAPQPYETNVEDGETPGAIGRQARPVRKGDGTQGYNSLMEGPFGVNPKPARKMAPDSIWTYHGKAELGLLETSGKAFEISGNHARNVRARFLEALSVVLMDPDTVSKQDLSGKALARIYAPLLALVDELREHYWDAMLARMISIMLRMTAKLGGKGIMVPGAERAAEILQRFNVPFDGATLWIEPPMTPEWGAYFSPTPEDTKVIVETAATAKGEGLITAETATRYVAADFGIADAEAEAEEIEGEASDKADREMASLHAAQKALAAAETPEAAPEQPAQPAADAEAEQPEDEEEDEERDD